MTFVDNRDVAAVFSRMADLMEIKGDNTFRIRAFRRVAQAIENLSENATTMLEQGTLKQVPGIGDGTIKRVGEIMQTGTCEDLVALSAALPPGLFDLLAVSGLGPKKVKLFYDELGISSVDELEAAARAGHLAALPRMGKKSQDKLITEIDAFRRRKGRVKLGDALPQGAAIVSALAEEPAVLRIDLAGSSRRRRETIGDLDVLVAAKAVEPVMERFVSLPQVREVMLRGDTKCSVRLHSSLQVDLRVLEPESYGAALHYFTGSQMHNIAVRDRAKRAGLRLNEYGIYKEPSGERLGGATEEEVFASVDLPYIPPELRENRGEIEAAERDELPALLEFADLRGDLHLPFETALPEAKTLSAIAEAARDAGLEYVAICARVRDKSGLTALRERLEEIEGKLGAPRLLAGIAADIAADGSVDLEAVLAAESDWVIAGLREQLTMSAEKITARIVRALESGLIDCLAHPSGRVLGEHDGYAVDLDAVLRTAQRTGVALELNADPERLDLDANHCRQARELSVPVAINSFARSPEQLSPHLQLGIYTARRGWLEAGDVLDTRPLSELEAWRAARRG